MSEHDETASESLEGSLHVDSDGAIVILFDLGQVDVHWDEDLAALWSFQIPSERPNLNFSIIRDLSTLYSEAQRLREKDNLPFRYHILGSRFPGVFSLGTDLELLAGLIERKDAASLNRYAHAMIEMFLQLWSSTDGNTITIGLAQGDALGAGFELLLSSNIIVAERSARFGFPEILFGMMSGLVVLPLLSRKLGSIHARRLLDEGRIYSAEEMHDMGLVNHLAEDGEGEQTVRDLIARTRSHFSGHAAIYAAERKIDPIEMPELSSMANIWVQSALKLDARNLRLMRRLASAQARLQK